MIVVRTFSNSDPPKLVELWNRQPALSGLAQPMTISLLEAGVFAKPYFEPKDLLIAEEEDRIVGLAHLIPSSPWQDEPLTASVATIPLLLAGKSSEVNEIEDALIEAAETRLAAAGVRQIQLGGSQEAGPFYFGLVGGSCNRGIPIADERMINLAERYGYSLASAWCVYELTLRGFRPPVDRGQITARRSLNVQRTDDPPFANFREASTFINHHRTAFSLIQKQDATELAHLTVVELEAFSHLRGARMAGIVDPQHLEVCTADQAKFFLADILRQLTEEGTAVVETQIPQTSTQLQEVVQTLGFTPANELRVYGKQLG